MNDTVRQFRDFFVSLKLTIVLLALSIILIFWATLAQVDLGIWEVQRKFFRTFIVLGHAGSVPVPMFPGGYFIGGLLFINLVAAHVYRFKLSWRKSGIFLTHIGLMLLLVGELLSGLWQKDYQMRLEEGETKSYSELQRSYELAIIDVTDPDYDDVFVVPAALLARGDAIQIPKLPFRITPKAYYSNVGIRVQPTGEPPAAKGLGEEIVVSPVPDNNSPDSFNVPATYVQLDGPEGPLGVWLALYAPREVLGQVASDLRIAAFPPLERQFSYDGRQWKIALRPERTYRDFSLSLIDFKHDVYAGTDIPKNFSSKVRLKTPSGGDDREVLIYMNNPLRYAGLTFYQAGYDPTNDKVTVLQVVKNPSWQLPYIACALMAIGLLTQFGIHLGGFMRKRRMSGGRAA